MNERGNGMDQMIEEQQSVASDEIEIDLRGLFLKLRQHWWMIIISIMIGVLLFGIYVFGFVKAQYQSSSLIYIRGTSSSKITSLQDLQLGAELTKDYEIIYKSRPVLEKVIKDLSLDMNVSTLEHMISFSNPSDTRILKVSVTSEDAKLSRDITNAVVKYGTDEVKEIDAKEPYMIEKAIINENKVSPSYKMYLMIGALIGLMISAGGITLMFILNDRIASVEDVERYLELPVLCVVSESAILAMNEKATKKRKKVLRHD